MNKDFAFYIIVILTMIGAIATIGCPPTIHGLVQKQIPAIIATSGENIYVVWGTNVTDNTTDVMFRMSSDGGQSYSDKINLSNTSGYNSNDFDIAATGNNVIVSWWEANSTNNIPVIVSSNDNGQTFGPILNLASNGTISGITN